MKILYGLILIKIVGCQAIDNEKLSKTNLGIKLYDDRAFTISYLKKHFKKVSGELAQGVESKSFNKLYTMFDHVKQKGNTKSSLFISNWAYKELQIKCYFYNEKLHKMVCNNIAVKNNIRYKELKSFSIQNYNDVLNDVKTTGSRNMPSLEDMFKLINSNPTDSIQH